MTRIIYSALLASCLLTRCTSSGPDHSKLTLVSPPSAVVGEVFHVSLMLVDSRALSDIRSARATVIVESAGCRVAFGVQRFENLDALAESDEAVPASRHDRTVWIPVVVSSQQAAEGAVFLRGNYDDGSTSIHSMPHALRLREPAAETLLQHSRNLEGCSDPAACLREIEYFRYVSYPDAADRLAALLPTYAHVPAAGEAVFAQRRSADAAALRLASREPNADAERLLDLANRLESGTACVGDVVQSNGGAKGPSATVPRSYSDSLVKSVGRAGGER
jgi:hypothetical protein